MKTILSKEIVDLGVSESDVIHMLKACGERKYSDYEPTLEELKVLLVKAYKEEKSKNRIVLSWESLLVKFNK